MYRLYERKKGKNDKEPLPQIIDIVILIGLIADRVIGSIPGDIFSYNP